VESKKRRRTGDKRNYVMRTFIICALRRVTNKEGKMEKCVERMKHEYACIHQTSRQDSNTRRRWENNIKMDLKENRV
jgi:hypothetical protein